VLFVEATLASLRWAVKRAVVIGAALAQTAIDDLDDAIFMTKGE
jgi:hypothetical protein